MDRDRPPVGGESARPPGPRLHNVEERHPQQVTSDGPGIGGSRRPQPPAHRPPPPGQGDSRRKVIGLNARDGEGSGSESGSDNRPKSKLKRPAPRGGAPSQGRPMPKRKPGRRDED